MWRVSSSIRPMAMPEVGLPNEPVPHTVTPRSAAAAMSIEALRMPVVMRSLRSGNFSRTARGKAVRSRMAQMILNPCRALMTFSAPPRCSLNTLMSTSPETFDQSATFRATFWKSSRIAQRYLAMGLIFLGADETDRYRRVRPAGAIETRNRQGPQWPAAGLPVVIPEAAMAAVRSVDSHWRFRARPLRAPGLQRMEASALGVGEGRDLTGHVGLLMLGMPLGAGPAHVVRLGPIW